MRVIPAAIFLGFTLVSIGWPLGQGALACAIAHNFFAASEVREAVSIFRGSVAGYDLAGAYSAKVRFVTTQTYRGEARNTWTLVLTNTLAFERPKDLEEFIKYYGMDTIVGVSVSRGYESPDLAQYQNVIQHPCGPPMMVKRDENNYLFKNLVELGAVPR